MTCGEVRSDPAADRADEASDLLVKAEQLITSLSSTTDRPGFLPVAEAWVEQYRRFSGFDQWERDHRLRRGSDG
jgi:hypothetical protein